MIKIVAFFKESYNELTHKVFWPKYSELQNSAILVLIASLIFALMIGVIDYAFDNLIGFIYEEL
ncbi:MAG: preprotein translocase subunit SecE [Ekhidna sp.]|nr:preprotein translocase subunit SecE [Ekhidna sp.]